MSSEVLIAWRFSKVQHKQSFAYYRLLVYYSMKTNSIIIILVVLIMSYNFFSEKILFKVSRILLLSYPSVLPY